MHFLPFTSVRIDDPFWSRRIQLVLQVVLPYQWKALNDKVEGAEKSYCIRNFRVAAGELDCKHGGAVFQDSDLYKWLEAVAYALAIERDQTLEGFADQAIDFIINAQKDDGYINTYYGQRPPEARFTNLMEGHELYCAGHLFEAAVAYKKATGKDKLLSASMRFMDCIYRTFSIREGYPGHPEIELALIKLYKETGEKRCLELAQRFIDDRGAGVSVFDIERNDPAHDWIWPEMRKFDDTYFLAHKPVRDLDTAQGHAVRAMYLFSAMADIASITRDAALKTACRMLYSNLIHKRMYVTGGIGSASFGERFTSDYDLPNDSAYAESCASVGLMMLSVRMAELTGDLRCFDIWEKALCNTVLAGMGQDGKHFFYVNPLASDPLVIAGNPTLSHVAPSRKEWFGVSCCPPNLARTILSLSGSLYGFDGTTLTLLSHIGNSFSIGALSGHLTVKGDEHALSLDGPACNVRIRIPEGHELQMESVQPLDGYVDVPHTAGHQTILYTLSPLIRVMRAHPRVSSDAGKACILRGASVYCLEEVDNGPYLSSLYLAHEPHLRQEPADFLPAGQVLIKADGYRVSQEAWGEALYSDRQPKLLPCELVFVPYGIWGNRGEGEMQVYVNAQ